YESQVYAAQAAHIFGGPLAVAGGPAALGPTALRDHRAGVLGDNDYDPVFGLFTAWKGGEDYYRASVARGADIFMFRQVWLRNDQNHRARTPTQLPLLHDRAPHHDMTLFPV